MDILDTKKFVWAYLLENGHETTGVGSFYGSGWERIPGRKWNYDYHPDLLQKVKDTGVDWNKTEEPESRTESLFEGTFIDCSECEALIGTLWLLDGSSYIVGCKDDDNMGSYINNLMKLMNDQNRVKNIFGE